MFTLYNDGMFNSFPLCKFHPVTGALYMRPYLKIHTLCVCVCVCVDV